MRTTRSGKFQNAWRATKALAAALVGASPFLLLAIPAFLAYVVIGRLALSGRPAEHELTKR